MDKIEGGSILKYLADLFFKGVDKIIDEEVEYEEEMGVLKQVSRVDLIDDETGEKTGTLTIKLSPVKNKKGYYYVEADTTVNGLDVSSINKKVIQINNESKKAFNKMIDDLLEKNNLAKESSNKADNDNDSEHKESDQESDKISNGLTDEQKTSIQEVMQSINNKSFVRAQNYGPNNVVYLEAKAELVPENDPDAHTCKITCYVYDSNNNDIPELKPDSKDLDLIDGNGSVCSADDLSEAINMNMDAYAKSHKLTNTNAKASLNSSIDVTLVKDKDTKIVSYTAIKASCDIKTATDMMYDIGGIDEFMDTINEDEEKSFRITDEGDDFVIDEIDSVETSSAYDEVFKVTNKLFNTLFSFYCGIGDIEWNNDNFLSNLLWDTTEILKRTGLWVTIHTGNCPYIWGTYSESPCLDTYKKEDGKIDIYAVKQNVKEIINELTTTVDFYYPNFEHEEQSYLDENIGNFKRWSAFV